MASKHHNPEKTAWKGRSYKNGKPIVELKTIPLCIHGQQWNICTFCLVEE